MLLAHICVPLNWAIIGASIFNGLVPVGFQAITWTNAQPNQCWLVFCKLVNNLFNGELVHLWQSVNHPCIYFCLQIMWRPVVVGFGLQILFGILVLRWKPGYDAIKWLSDQIMTFINYSLEGASIVFGDPTMLFHPFVFVVSSTGGWRIVIVT